MVVSTWLVYARAMAGSCGTCGAASWRAVARGSVVSGTKPQCGTCGAFDLPGQWIIAAIVSEPPADRSYIAIGRSFVVMDPTEHPEPELAEDEDPEDEDPEPELAKDEDA